mmetsp:Transcript_14166/g.45509  ORF Transcript_14166/g.45509 Transcript_14166/m.45509 type:complete len:225 (+) Transcript_14166:657-1331(+)
MPYGAELSGWNCARKRRMSPRCSLRMSASGAQAATRSTIPSEGAVASTRYAVSCKSSPCARSSESISRSIASTIWSWRKSSPLLKMIAYEPPPPPSEEVEEEAPPPLPAGGRRSARKVTEMGERADLKTVERSGRAPTTAAVGSRGRMSGASSERSGASGPASFSNMACSRAIRFGRDSPAALSACAAAERAPTSASCRRSIDRRAAPAGLAARPTCSASYTAA